MKKAPTSEENVKFYHIAVPTLPSHAEIENQHIDTGTKTDKSFSQIIKSLNKFQCGSVKRRLQF